MLQRFLLITLTLCSLSATAQWQQTGSKVRYVNGLGIPTKDTAAGVAADSSQIVIRPADSALYIKYKRTWLRVGGGGGSIAGSGTTNYIPKFTSSTAIGNSLIYDNGTAIGISVIPSTWGGASIKSIELNATGNSLAGLGNADIVLMSNAYFNSGFLYAGANKATSYRQQDGIHKWNIAPTGIVGNPITFTQEMTLDSSGRLGIGYTAPAAKLAVQGTTLINTNTDNGVDKLQVSGSMNVSTLATTNNLSVTTNATVGGNARVSGTAFVGGAADNGVDKLQVSNTSGVYTGLSIANTNAALKLIVNNLGNISIGTTAFMQMDLVTNNTIRQTIAADGKILINGAGTNTQDQVMIEGSIFAKGYKQSYVTKTGAYTATDNDYVIDCTSGTFTVTLPASNQRTGRILIIKNSGAGTITVDGNGAETIDGAATYAISVQYGTIQIMSDGTNWKIIAKF